MKFCEKCGAQMPDEAICCTNCGSPLSASQIPNQSAEPQQQYQYQYQQPPFQQQQYQQQNVFVGQVDQKTKNMAIAALVLGILSIVSGKMFIGLILGIAGIIISVKVRNVLPKGITERTMATIGMVCSIIGVVIGGLALICAVTCGTIGACAACAEAGTYLSEYTDVFTAVLR